MRGFFAVMTVVGGLGGLVVGQVGCTRRNPEVCCSTPVECDHFGFDDITPCEGVKVCLEGACVSPTCTSSADCAAPAPYCVGMTCAAACTQDADCVGIAGLPSCAPDGACVECLDSSQCTAPEAAVCDDATHACRPCTDDTECASGICLAAEGVCAAEADAVYLSMAGADAGECTAAAPCLTVAYGLARITAQRRVLRIASLDYVIPDGVTIGQDVYVDAASSRVSRTSAGPILTVNNSANVRIEGVRIENALAPAIDVIGSADVQLYAADVVRGSQGAIRVANLSTLGVFVSHFDDSGVECNFGGLTVEDSVFERRSTGSVVTTSCATIVRRTRFLSAGVLSSNGDTITFENNLVAVATNAQEGPALTITSAQPGSAVRFNTVVNVTVNADAALRCVGGAVVTSNVVAWSSPTPIAATTTCPISRSVFDSAASTVPPGNLSAPIGEIFVDPTTDYRPNPTSPARGAGQPGLVDEDLEQTPRPSPAGTDPDAGAYEVP